MCCGLVNICGFSQAYWKSAIWVHIYSLDNNYWPSKTLEIQYSRQRLYIDKWHPPHALWQNEVDLKVWERNSLCEAGDVREKRKEARARRDRWWGVLRRWSWKAFLREPGRQCKRSAPATSSHQLAPSEFVCYNSRWNRSKGRGASALSTSLERNDCQI